MTRPRVSPFALFVAGVLVLLFGLYAVGSGRIYSGDTWPDFLTIFAASLLVARALLVVAARGADGEWSWRTLRPRAFVGCALAFILLLVMSVVVPAETGVWPVGDSAHGFSLFLFVESVVVAVTCAVKAPGRAGVTSLSGHPVAGARNEPPAARIALRRWRLFSRDTYVDVDRTGVTLVVPRVFGGRRGWFVPMGAVGVLLEPAVPDAGWEDAEVDEDAEEWVTREEFRTPYLSTTSPWAPPNLVLFFTLPQPLPPIRWSARRDLDISVFEGRSAEGFLVDGVELRAVDPGAAREVLLANGAQGIDDPEAFVKRHRDVVRDPEQVRAAVARSRREGLLFGITGVASVALFVAFHVTDDDRYGLAFFAVLGLGLLLEWLSRRPRR
ncbi:MAG: hypothetical protein HOQ13_13255 [Dermatophilaceae bacterium]|nr:hypothetical protein [Dermatophilaceae bacterium]